jgi:hypothetical protein
MQNRIVRTFEQYLSVFGLQDASSHDGPHRHVKSMEETGIQLATNALRTIDWGRTDSTESRVAQKVSRR